MKKDEYLAGLFDGRGYFSVQINVRNQRGKESIHFAPRMILSLSNDKGILDEFVKRFGGQIYTYKGYRKWSLGSRDNLLTAAQAIEPYLHIKSDECGLFLLALHSFPNRKGNPFKGEKSWDIEAINRVTRIALKLNPNTKLDTINSVNELAAVYSTVDAILMKGDL